MDTKIDGQLTAEVAEHISFKGAPLDVCEHASLIVLGKGDELDKAMTDHLNQQVESIRLMMGNAEVKFGKVVIKFFTDEGNLKKLLRDEIDEKHHY